MRKTEHKKVFPKTTKKCKKPIEKEIHRQYANQWYRFATSKI